MATPIPAKAVLEFTPRPRTLPADRAARARGAARPGAGAIAGPGHGPTGRSGQAGSRARSRRRARRDLSWWETFVMRGQGIEGASPTSSGRCTSVALRHPVVRSFRGFERRCLRPASPPLFSSSPVPVLDRHRSPTQAGTASPAAPAPVSTPLSSPSCVVQRRDKSLPHNRHWSLRVVQRTHPADA